MTSKFEQLIEYVINDEEQKARELFHDIVVEKSREIYENLMNEEEEEMDEAKDEEMHEGEELEEAKHDEEDGEELEEAIGGDAADDLIDDVEMEEEGMEMSEAEEGEEDKDDLEDRVVDLEDKLDELMAEFEAMMGDDGAEDDFGAEGGDELEMDDTAEFDDEGNAEEVEMDAEEEFMEGVDLKAAPAPVKSEEASVNKKSTVAANSGAAGMAASPVKMTGDVAKGRPAPAAKDMGGTTSPKQGPAPKPVTTQATGVNTKTPFPKG